MLRRAKIVGVMLALVLSVSAFSGPAYAQTCDTTGTVNGTATPVAGIIGDTINFRATGFQVGEEVSFWFTSPSGVVVGTANPVPGGVQPDGSVALVLRIGEFPVIPALFGEGRWALTVQGATSNNTAVIYFCVGFRATQATPTSTAAPPTNTPPPSTATSPPATTATVAATATGVTTATVPPVETPAASPTAVPAGAPTGSLTANDQVVSDNSVVVASVTAGQDGWLVVHESLPDGTMSVQGVIGKAPVTAGTHTDLRVTLDRAAVNGETVWPMLHIDNGQIGVYEFPAADPPVVVNGEVVMQPIVLTVVGMPRTGENDLTFLVLAGLVGLGLLAAGLGARRGVADR